ncbi:MAG: hypothetical protein H6882_06600 [Rhodobiaceae bacterium]|nr:hypothetical protein [Rhodobiaceae bacterium]
MDDLLGVVSLICIAAFFFGLFLLLFKKGRRLRGLGYVFASLIALGVAGTQLRETQTQQASQSADAAGEGVGQTQAPERAPEPPQWQQAGFPDEASYSRAVELKIKSYALYQRLDDQEAIAAYCEWRDAGWAVTVEADKRFGEAPEGDQYTKKQAWEEPRQIQLRDELLEKLGLKDWELYSVSDAGKWLTYCAARKASMPVLTLEMATAATDDEAEKARQGIEAYYLWRLKDEPGGFFNSDLFGGVTCRAKPFDANWIVGCRLIAWATSTKWDYFVVAADDKKRLLAAPLFGSTKPHVDGVKVFTAPGLPEVHQAKYALPVPDRGKLDEAFGE